MYDIHIYMIYIYTYIHTYTHTYTLALKLCIGTTTRQESVCLHLPWFVSPRFQRRFRLGVEGLGSEFRGLGFRV